jgi:hypothetical protein
VKKTVKTKILPLLFILMLLVSPFTYTVFAEDVEPEGEPETGDGETGETPLKRIQLTMRPLRSYG